MNHQVAWRGPFWGRTIGVETQFASLAATDGALEALPGPRNTFGDKGKTGDEKVSIMAATAVLYASKPMGLADDELDDFGDSDIDDEDDWLRKASPTC